VVRVDIIRFNALINLGCYSFLFPVEYVTMRAFKRMYFDPSNNCYLCKPEANKPLPLPFQTVNHWVIEFIC